MTLKKLIEVLPDLKDKERGILHNLCTVLTPLSIKTLAEFEDKWDGRRPYEEFVQEQNKVFLSCIGIEKHEFGAMVRGALGLQPLNDDTEIPEVQPV